MNPYLIMKTLRMLRSLERWQEISLTLVAFAALFLYSNTDWAHSNWAARWTEPFDVLASSFPVVALLLAVIVWTIGDMFLVKGVSLVIVRLVDDERRAMRTIGAILSMLAMLFFAGIIVFVSSVFEPLRTLVLFGEAEGMLSGAIFPIWFFVLVTVNAPLVILISLFGTESWLMRRSE